MSESLSLKETEVLQTDDRAVGEKAAEAYAEKERELSEYVKDQIIYAGLFVNPDELYKMFPPTLSHRIRDPHITVFYRPDESKVHLEALGSGAEIAIVGYGIDEEMGNEGLSVVVRAKNPDIQKGLDENVQMNEDGEMEFIRAHITTSIDAENGAQAFNTRKLDFKPLDEPVVIEGSYNLFRKDGVLIKDAKTVEEMKKSGFSVDEEVKPDLL